MWPFSKKKNTIRVDLSLPPVIDMVPIPSFEQGEIDISFKLEVNEKGEYAVSGGSFHYYPGDIKH